MEIARNVLTSAIEAIDKGSQKHGEPHDSFIMIAQLWSVYLQHTLQRRQGNQLQAHDVAEMMSLLKKARAAYASVADNYVDDAGYTSLAAMLNPRITTESFNE